MAFIEADKGIRLIELANSPEASGSLGDEEKLEVLLARSGAPSVNDPLKSFEVDRSSLQG
jgi:hypothetical protein